MREDFGVARVGGVKRPEDHPVGAGGGQVGAQLGQPGRTAPGDLGAGTEPLPGAQAIDEQVPAGA